MILPPDATTATFMFSSKDISDQLRDWVYLSPHCAEIGLGN